MLEGLHLRQQGQGFFDRKTQVGRLVDDLLGVLGLAAWPAVGQMDSSPQIIRSASMASAAGFRASAVVEKSATSCSCELTSSIRGPSITSSLPWRSSFIRSEKAVRSRRSAGPSPPRGNTAMRGLGSSAARAARAGGATRPLAAASSKATIAACPKRLILMSVSIPNRRRQALAGPPMLWFASRPNPGC
jgi:hypothetical protein